MISENVDNAERQKTYSKNCRALPKYILWRKWKATTLMRARNNNMILVIQNSHCSCLTRKGLIGLWMKIPLNLWPGTIWPLNPSTLIRLELCICKSNRIINILCTKKSNRVPSQEILDSKGFCGIEPQS